MTEDHLSFEGNCGVRPKAGDPTVSGPSLSSVTGSLSYRLPAGDGAPRDFMAPHTCDELSC
ncbi:hypothetical protein Acsp02_50150 [Actinoplanes sp. NBRC 103695]|nr:hypothetical protein Acsp02_50150 [Actinoplanes sp. NBRC 103695]